MSIVVKHFLHSLTTKEKRVMRKSTKQEKKIPPKEEPHMEYTKHIKRHTLISDQFPASNLIFNYSKTMNSVLSMSKRAEHHKISP